MLLPLPASMLSEGALSSGILLRCSDSVSLTACAMAALSHGTLRSRFPLFVDESTYLEWAYRFSAGESGWMSFTAGTPVVPGPYVSHRGALRYGQPAPAIIGALSHFNK